MAEYIDRETILDDLDVDIKVTNKERLLAKEKHCVEDRMRYAKKLDHLRGFSKYVESLPTADVIPIPEGATNGNMFMTMFPDAEVVEVKYFDGVVSHYKVNLGKINGNQNIVNFKSDWWDAPHKKNCIPSEYDYLEDMELTNPQMHR